MKTIVLYTGTNVLGRDRNLKREFKDISWWSRDLATINHYYEGHVVEITVHLDDTKEMEFVSSDDKVDYDTYTWGSAILAIPKDAIWYSFSSNYLKEHVTKIEEVKIEDLEGILC